MTLYSFALVGKPIGNLLATPIVLVSVKRKSPAGPERRPFPDCFIPPIGAAIEAIEAR
jgi:hypothetical protein